MSPHTTPATDEKLVAISMSFDRDNLLARGLGLEHLKELLIRLARPLLREEVSLGYGGHWQEAEDNFTFELLRLVSAEKAVEAERKTVGLESPKVGRLINHSAWPDYQKITPAIEAEWINACRIVRVTPEMARFTESLPTSCSQNMAERKALLRKAVCLSSMRKFAQNGITLEIPDSRQTEIIPPISARIVLGGRIAGYSGFVPGIVEEVLLSLEAGKPLFLLGGFGGAAEVLAKALLAKFGAPMPVELGETWQRRHTPALTNLTDAFRNVPIPSGVRNTAELLATTRAVVENARSDLPAALNCGLNEADTRRLLATSDMREAITLVRKGLLALRLLRETP